jgi:DNA-binding transcriptional LysR family regulator
MSPSSCGSAPRATCRPPAVNSACRRRRRAPAWPSSNASIELDLRLSDTVIDLAAHGIDVAIRVGPLRDSALVARTLAPSRLVLVAAPSYLAAHGEPRHPDELIDHQCLVLDGSVPWSFQVGAQVQRMRVGGRLRSDNGEAMRDAAIAGLGIALQSTWAVAEHLKSGQLVRVMRDYPVAVDAVISAQYLNRSFLPLKSKVFIDFFAARFGPTPYWEEGLV